MSQWAKQGINERLRELVGDINCSFADIAAKLNHEFGVALSRSAVIGRAHRMGFSIGAVKRAAVLRRGWEQSARTRQSNAQPRKPKANIRATRGGGGSRVMRIVHRKKTLTDLFGVLSDGLRDLPPDRSPCAVTLLDATADQCRWPVSPVEGDAFLFCGDMIVPNRPYCVRHCHRAYAVPREGIEHLPKWMAA